MRSAELDNLVAIGQLKHGESSRREVEVLLRSGRARLEDARNDNLTLDSRFDLAYNAAHALALAALRHYGLRTDHRYTVFQVLPQTLGVPASVWRVLAKAHGERNLIEYEGGGELDERLLTDLIAATDAVERALRSVLS